jgi:hypothetical protein
MSSWMTRPKLYRHILRLRKSEESRKYHPDRSPERAGGESKGEVEGSVFLPSRYKYFRQKSGFLHSAAVGMTTFFGPVNPGAEYVDTP